MQVDVDGSCEVYVFLSMFPHLSPTVKISFR